MKIRLALCGLLLSSLVHAESIDEALEGFDDSTESSTVTPQNSKLIQKDNDNVMDGFDDADVLETSESKKNFVEGLTGKFTEQLAFSYRGRKPHNNLTSMKSSLFLDYEHKFENGWRFKTNAKAYYDAIYDLRNKSHLKVPYSNDELDEQRSEVRLYDVYVEGSLSDKIDMKLGRQVVVWGRSDTIRITDVLNPLDSRRPGMVDIEDLRLPVTMAKLDFFWGDWRITPIAVLEQFFTINPAFGSAFNPQPNPHMEKKSYDDVTYALSVGGEFSGWDVNFYAARLHDDAGYVKFKPKPIFKHDKVNMFGTALNVLYGPWLLKTELAYFDGLKYTSTQDKTFSRTDMLIGTEYKGIADTMISYDFSLRHLNHYDERLKDELFLPEQNFVQHAFRVTSDFMNATLHLNYLISLYGLNLDEGGFQRAWVRYDIADGITTNVGVVDYIGGSKLFDIVHNNDMVFADISYNF